MQRKTGPAAHCPGLNQELDEPQRSFSLRFNSGFKEPSSLSWADSQGPQLAPGQTSTDQLRDGLQQRAKPASGQVNQGLSQLARASWRGQLWLHRRLITALAVLLCALLAAQALTNPSQAKVWVIRTDMSLGQVISSSDVVLSNLPTSPPQAVRTSPVGRKLSIDLPKGTALIESMLTGPALSHLGKQQRVVQLQIQTGSQLARIGQQVDIVGSVDGTTNGGVVSSDGAYSKVGAQVLARKVTIVDVEPPNKANLTQTQGTMRLITFAVKETEATLLCGAASQGPLSIVLRP
ncbi:hypothetical protein CJ186_05935 [Actinomyces graevenitzii]|uniref:SAF domain-containing protein n=1 Tax=Actinomyces graevenitzii C83 TaxID=435830 RepID=G9PGS3_9ACTO|nr:SAF domain-containing protein [Actinomyces graevenitzii]EHM87760.1 hypothetical protein HMPREF0045_01447 [Actinomyces graevenitzii C83]PMC91623.1 hypothetical protein CJ186_05935 [Actinomyces graevenitzii]